MFNHFFQLRRLILLLVLLAGWEFASRFILDKTQATLLPPPSGVINGFIDLSDKELRYVIHYDVIRVMIWLGNI